ncbi:MAG: MBL fold metallo-hydrolase [Planctomycetes bacterium]|nr:MBL fold metallo-hydrolase [Planctomycetota bacterium]
MPLRITILGSGTSHGVPMIACDCPVCTSTDPRDQRTRTGGLFSYDGHNVLIDTGPELRLQCVANGVRRADAVLYTHCHADHVAGLDDLRRFNWIQQQTLDLYSDGATAERLKQMFPYAFADDPDYPSAKPQLRLNVRTEPFELFGRRVQPIHYLHGRLPVLGYRIGAVAYCTDCNFIPAESRPLLDDLDILILDAVRRRPHSTHFNLEEAVAEAHRIGARRTYFTHIAHELGHAQTNAELPPGMALAYDGLVLESD